MLVPLTALSMCAGMCADAGPLKPNGPKLSNSSKSAISLARGSSGGTLSQSNRSGSYMLDVSSEPTWLNGLPLKRLICPTVWASPLETNT